MYRLVFELYIKPKFFQRPSNNTFFVYKWCYASNQRRYADYIAPNIQVRDLDSNDPADSQIANEIILDNHATTPQSNPSSPLSDTNTTNGVIDTTWVNETSRLISAEQGNANNI